MIIMFNFFYEILIKIYLIIMIILYGSQHGNAKAIAQDIYYNLNNEQIPLLSLNESLYLFEDNNNIKNETIVIVISTTGNGDVPINSEKWWRFIKKRSLDRNYCEGLNFYVLALGDSNYDNFCGAGKKVYKRLVDLKAFPLEKLITIDDVDGDYEEKINYILELINN